MNPPIPLKILDQHLVILGKTGSGKSSVMRVLIESLLDKGERVCIIDPKGDHYGLKLGADGKSAGYGVMAFGNFKNEQATDFKINRHAGKEIAELIVSGNRPAMIGFRGWMPAEMHDFWIDFASTLFGKNKAPIILAADEVHNFAPKTILYKEDKTALALHWANRLGAEGRGNGITIMMASQRPQKVHNDLLTCAETLVAMKVTHPSERKPFAEWMKEYGDSERGNLILSNLSKLKKGEAFVWSPEAEFFERIQFP